MNPYNIIGLEDIQQGVAKNLINVSILFPKCRIIDGERREIVKQWPNGRVAKSEVELVHLFFGKKDGVGSVGRQGLLFQASSQRRLNARARPTNPKMIARKRSRPPAKLHVGSQTGYQTTRAVTEGE